MTDQEQIARAREFLAQGRLDLASPRYEQHEGNFEQRVLWYMVDVATFPSVPDIRSAFDHTGDHADYPSTDCCNDCKARHEAYRRILFT